MSFDSKIPDAVNFYEGMLLAPQHFQQLSARHEILISTHAAWLSPYYWGVVDCTLDEAAIAAGILRVLRIEAAMPDGTWVSFLDGNGRTLEIDLKPHLPRLKDGPEKVYLALAARTDSTGTDEDVRRLDTVEGPPVADLNTGKGDLRVLRMKHRLSLVFGKPSAKFTFFPLVEVDYQDNHLALTQFSFPASTGTGPEQVIKSRYSYPVLGLDQRSAIFEACRRLSGEIRRKATQVSGSLIGDQGDSEVSLTKGLPLFYLLAGLPRLEAILASRQPHPFLVYLALTDIVGFLAPLGREKIPPFFKAYDHDDLFNTFVPILRYLTDLIDERVHEAFSSVYFQREGQQYQIRFRKDWLERGLVVGFQKAGAFPDRYAHEWMDGALIGPRTQIEDLRNLRVFGIRRFPVAKVAGLVPPEHTLLYRLDPLPGEIAAGEDLVISPAVSHAENLMPENLILFIATAPSIRD